MKKVASLVLASIMVMSTGGVTAYADNGGGARVLDSAIGASSTENRATTGSGIEVDIAGGSGDSSVTLEVIDGTGGGGEDPGPSPRPDIFSATIPSIIPIKIDSSGAVTTPNNLTVDNNVSNKGIKVSQVEVTLGSGWAASEFTDDYSTKATDTKELGFKLRRDTLKTDGTFPITASDWNIAKGTSLDLGVLAKLAKQTGIGNKGQIATVHFTLDWSGDDDSTSNPSIGDKYTVSYSAGANGTVLGNATREFMEGSTLTFPSVEATEGYELDKWVILGTSTEVTATTVVTDNISVEAQFIIGAPAVEELVTVQFESDNNGTLEGETTLQVKKGATAVFPTPVPIDLRYTFDKWVESLNGTEITPTAAMSNDTSIKAIFAQRAYDPASWFVVNSSGEFTGFTAEYNNLANAPTDIVIPNQVGGTLVRGIGATAFLGKSALTSVVIPDGVSVIGKSAFRNCGSLSDVYIPSGMQSLGDWAFSECGALEDLKLPDTITTIGHYAFENCTQIKEFTVTDKMTSIGLCLTGIDGITINMHKSAANHSSYPFGAINSESVLKFERAGSWDTNPITSSQLSAMGLTFDKYNGVLGGVDGGAVTVHLPTSVDGEKVRELLQFKITNTRLVLPNVEFKWPSYGLLASYTKVRLLEIPGGVKKVGRIGSLNAEATSVKIEEGVEELHETFLSIGFNNGKVLDVVLPDSLKVIGDSSFHYSGVAVKEVPDGVTTVGQSAFQEVDYTRDIKLPKSITSIGQYAFSAYTGKIIIDKPAGSLSGAPWGAKTASLVKWAGSGY